MPIFQRLLRVEIEARIAVAELRNDPARLEPEHHMHRRWRNRQISVNRRRERVDKLGPFRREQPQSRRTSLAKFPLCS